MPLVRTPHWATREFHDFLLAHADAPFVWGANDCCTFAANAILSFTGTDIAEDFRGKYSNEREAFELITTITGGTTVADAAAYCANNFGLVELSAPLFAQRGDLVLVQDTRDVIAGVIHLNGRDVVVVGDKGLKRQPITNVLRAWRV